MYIWKIKINLFFNINIIKKISYINKYLEDVCIEAKEKCHSSDINSINEQVNITLIGKT